MCAPSIRTRPSRTTGLFPRGRGTAGREQMWMEIAPAQPLMLYSTPFVSPAVFFPYLQAFPAAFTGLISKQFMGGRGQQKQHLGSWTFPPKYFPSTKELKHKLVTLQTSTLSSPARSEAKAKGSHYSCRDLASSAVSREKPH